VAWILERCWKAKKRTLLQLCTCLQIHFYNVEIEQRIRELRVFQPVKISSSIVVFRQNCEVVCLALYCEMISDKEPTSM
jgi:hypothetical protein